MNPLKAATKIYKLRSSWLGEGGDPVPTPQAIARAEVCLTSGPNGTPCPFNQARAWENIARYIVSWALEIDKLRHELKLSTGKETGLHVCDKCGCVLRSKIWTPTKFLVEITPVNELKDFPDYCWLAKEVNGANK